MAPAIERTLRTLHPEALPIEWGVEPEPEHGGHRLVATTRRSGVAIRTAFDAESLASADRARLVELAARVRGLGAAPYQVVGEGGEAEPFASPTRLLARVLERARKGLTVQRYKGLGEMNPDQLAETTMNAATRTLLQVRVEDAIEADEVLSRLMGDEVEPRREFIEQNALYVQNLDV